jgi:putative inorganic carbon (HCO3(-)) transporter
MMLEKPVFGFGPDNLNMPFKGTVMNVRPHNTFIQIGASLGIPALLFYLSALFKHLHVFIKNYNTSTFEDYGLFMVVLGYLISSFFGNTEVYTTPIFIIILVFSYTLINKKYN